MLTFFQYLILVVLFCDFSWQTEMSQQRLASSTIKTYLAGLRHAQIVQGYSASRESSLPRLWLLQAGEFSTYWAGLHHYQRMPANYPTSFAPDLWSLECHSSRHKHCNTMGGGYKLFFVVFSAQERLQFRQWHIRSSSTLGKGWCGSWQCIESFGCLCSVCTSHNMATSQGLSVRRGVTTHQSMLCGQGAGSSAISRGPF